MPERITGTTRLGGLLGSPVAHSKSPLMHNEAFRLLGLDYVYLCFDMGPENLARTVEALRDLHVYGFNLTMPLKTAVIPCLDALPKEAKLIGAVNTVKNDDGTLTGYNTDGMGFMRSVREHGVTVPGSTITILGAGGAASAISVQAAIDGAAAVHIVSRRGRSWEKAQDLARRISENTACRADLTDLGDTAALSGLLQASDLLVNATSVGMAPHTDESPLPDPAILPPSLPVGDVIYHPAKTLLLSKAAERGCPTFNGMDMLLYQGEAAFRIWTGQNMPVEQIRALFFSE